MRGSHWSLDTMQRQSGRSSLGASTTAIVCSLTLFASRVAVVGAVTCHRCSSSDGSQSGCQSSNTTDVINALCSGTTCYSYRTTNETILDCSDNATFIGCKQSTDEHDAIVCYCNSTDFCFSSSNAAASPNDSVAVASTTSTPVYTGTPWWLPTGAFGPHEFTCYKCNSQQDGYCGRTMDKSKAAAWCTAPACMTFIGTVDGKSVITRDCAFTGPTTGDCISATGDWDGYKYSGDFCLCRSDYCNEFVRPSHSAAVSVHFSGRILFTAVMSVLLLQLVLVACNY